MERGKAWRGRGRRSAKRAAIATKRFGSGGFGMAVSSEGLCEVGFEDASGRMDVAVDDLAHFEVCFAPVRVEG